MKVIYCLPQIYMPGGIERICSIKANYFADVLNWEVVIIAAEQKEQPSYYKLSEKVRLIDLAIPYSSMQSQGLLSRIFTKRRLQKLHRSKLEDILCSEQADVVVSTLTHEVNFITNIKDGSKKVLEFHFCKGHKRKMADAFGYGLFTKLAYYAQCWREENILIPQFDQFVVLTNEDLLSWQNDIKTVKSIPNILPFENSEIAKLTEKHVIAVGRYDAQKRFDHLIRIWAKVSRKHPDWVLDIYGQGKDKENLTKLISQLECSSSITLHSPSKNIKQCYLDSSIFVMTSTYEGLPMTLLEANALGLPTICYDFKCGPKDVIENGVNGFIIREGDIDGFADKLDLLMSDDSLRSYMGNKAYAMSDRFSLDIVMQKWIDLFENLTK